MNKPDPRRHLINISKPLITSYGIRAKIVAILPDHPFPLVVATDASRPLELRCFDVFGNPANNHTFVLYNDTDADAPRPRESENVDQRIQDDTPGTG